jgi:hypothetical protein
MKSMRAVRRSQRRVAALFTSTVAVRFDAAAAELVGDDGADDVAGTAGG